MRHYEAATAKRHFAVANSPLITRLDKGKLSMTGVFKRSKVKTCEKYRDRSGKVRYKGTSSLKGTELLVFLIASL